MRHLRIRQLLLLLVRSLIIVCLVLAFSRPTFNAGAGLWQDRSPIEAVVVVDNTLSMNEVQLTGTLLEQLRATFAALEGVFGPGDRITVVQSSLPTRLLADRLPYQAGLWEQINKKIEPNALRSDLSAALELALTRCENSPLLNREIYLISDFQSATLPPGRLNPLAERAARHQIRTYALPISHRNLDNLSVDSVAVLNRLIERNQPLQVRAWIKNHHPQKHLSSLVSLLLNGKRVAQKNVTVPPEQQAMVTFRVTLTEEGFVAGALELESDALMEDNHRFFNFYLPHRIKVLHLSDREQGGSFVPFIIRPALAQHIFDYRSKSLKDWTGVDFSAFDVLIVEGFHRLPGALISRLEHFRDLGGSVVLIPGPELDPESTGRLLRALGLGKLAGRWGRPGQKTQFLTLQSARWNHPLFEGLFEAAEPSLNPIEVYAGYRVKPSPKATALIELSDGTPFLLSSRGERGHAYWLASPLELDWNQLPVKGFVVPLFYRLIYYGGSQRVRGGQHLLTGQSRTLAFENLKPPFDFTAQDPLGQALRLTPRFRSARVLLKLPPLVTPGNYRLVKAGETIGLVSVNPWPQESDVRCLSDAALREWLPGLVILNGSDTELGEQVARTRLGQELWAYLLAAALVLLLVEMALARTGTARREQLGRHKEPVAQL